MDLNQIKELSRQAYVYGYPIVDNYRILYAYSVDPSNPEYQGAMNQVHSTARVYTPEDKTIQTPNSDTPYSIAVLDLRSEPVVITLPPIGADRYYSVQMVDLFTFNFDYLGTRSTGNEGGDFLVVGPGWKGEIPPGIKKVSRSDTELALLIYRTQLFNPEDIENVKKIQSGYKIRGLASYTGRTAPPAAAPISFIKPLTIAEEKSSLDFFNILNFVLTLCPPVSSEIELLDQFQKIGVKPGHRIDFLTLDSRVKEAMVQGMQEGQAQISKTIAAGTSSADWFGTRKFLKNNYLIRAAAAQAGIYGNSKEEAMYFPYKFDEQHEALDASQYRYILRFAPGQLPPSHAFWSVTLYGIPSQLLVANPIHRYLINSSMLPQLKKDPDGGLTLYIQSSAPEEQKKSNWLPAPQGRFFLILRDYYPLPTVLSGAWKPPLIQKVQ